MGGAYDTYGRHERFIHDFAKETREKRPLGRPRENNIKIDLQAVVWGTDWIDLFQERDRWQAIFNAVMNLRFL
jgi:hypothetical protein